jgi:hypothetical protein
MAAPRRDVLSEVDGYRVDGVLGRGASGVVYRVADPRLQRSMALKLLDDDGDPEGRARFHIEAQAAARIVHPNVVQVFGAGEHGGRPYILMELVEGLPISDVVRARGPLAPEAVAEIGVQAAEGLAAAARVGVLHRDVKPHNLLLTEEGAVKLADFGLARLVNGPSGLTQDGTTLGTPHYMSPEQGQGRPLDHRSDQYALGATLYHLLTGAPPFDDEHAVALLLKHAQADLPPVRSRNPTCPDALAGVVERMLAKDPDARFPDFEAVVEALEATQAGGEGGSVRALAVAAEAARPRREPPARAQEPGLERAVLLGLALAAAGVVLAAQVATPSAPTRTGRGPGAPSEVPVPVAPAALTAGAPQAPAVRAQEGARQGLRRQSTERLIQELRRGPARSVPAAVELGRRADQRATFALLEALAAADEVSAAALGDALAQLGDIRALPELRRLADQGRSEAVRAAAGRAHRRLYRVEE